MLFRLLCHQFIRLVSVYASLSKSEKAMTMHLVKKNGMKKCMQAFQTAAGTQYAALKGSSHWCRLPSNTFSPTPSPCLSLPLPFLSLSLSLSLSQTIPYSLDVCVFVDKRARVCLDVAYVSLRVKLERNIRKGSYNASPAHHLTTGVP